MLYAICGPSRAGKTTLLNGVLALRPQLIHLVTYTTRVPRDDESDSMDYHFVTVARFREMLESRQMVYPILYRGEHYGVRKDDLLKCAPPQDAIAVLRPDGIPHLAQYVSLVGIYVVPDDNSGEPNPEDDVIRENRHLCSYTIANPSGNPSSAVRRLLAIMEEVSRDHR